MHVRHFAANLFEMLAHLSLIHAHGDRHGNLSLLINRVDCEAKGVGHRSLFVSISGHIDKRHVLNALPLVLRRRAGPAIAQSAFAIGLRRL